MPMAQALASMASASIPMRPGTYVGTATKASSKLVIAASNTIDAQQS